MSLLAGLKEDTSIQGGDVDTLGGSVRESDIYKFQITMAYVIQSKGGATGIVLELVDKDGRNFSTTEYITNRNGQNFYTNQKGEKSYLPGFTLVNTIARLATGKPISEQDTEEKVVSMWNSDAKKEVPTKVPALVDMIGQGIALGIQKVRENKSEKNEATGKYEPTSEDRIVNSVNKAFDFDTLKTITELEGGEEIPQADLFATKWLERNKGKLIDRYKEVKAEAKSGRPAAASQAAPKPTSSLFD